MGNSPSTIYRGRSMGSLGSLGSPRRKNVKSAAKNIEATRAPPVEVEPVSPATANLDFSGPRPPPPSPMVPEKHVVYDLTGEEDVCPTCLEDYSDSNPQIDTKCGHTFHLSCILEWQLRNPHCPICAQHMEWDE
eukprot:Plantae.Rhodophyta-Purpureofilum_apyrenoidigerum.ctg10558.p1 GENE.Plantae.Rhodophyta-Purpureofilum_apyrenoidigerum.ctg10558~~Plantae.Rhodophyta-Purpureofilum_apyrenoidigerum.ctg10558.p1  ORF type:complete len:134 (+),score=8.30 Plantae.Rhodophyta-Purpureofilum_apyrenoidigerum.ctg10558:396-797(+)